MMTINQKKLEAMLINNCMTIRDLSQSTGVSAQTLSSLVSGRRKSPRRETLGKLVKALNCSLDDIVD